jgi:hypothetical protein
MKPFQLGIAVLAWAVAGLAISHPLSLRASGTNAPAERIGVYDSRVVAYAWFCSAPHQSALNARIKAAKQAKAAGETEKFKQLAAALQKEQEQMHLESFGTAPIDDALAELRPRLAALQEQAHVSTLVSKWDAAALKLHPGAEQVDVTDALVREFKPGEKQLKVIEELKRAKPVPMEKLKSGKD